MTGARNGQMPAVRPVGVKEWGAYGVETEVSSQLDSIAGLPAVAGRVLVVVDEPVIAESVPACLRFAGYEAHLVRSGTQALEAGERLRPHLVVLDTDISDIDVFAVARRFRELGNRIPMLFLISMEKFRGRGVGLTVGGDDYLVKPFSLDELTARVRAALRRAAAADGVRRPDAAVLRFADLEFNEDTQEVRRGGHLLRLAPRERDILRYLLVSAGRAVTRAHIYEHVWPYNHTGHARALDVHICSLRRKIDQYGPPLIHTVHGVGYMLRRPETSEGEENAAS